MFSVYKFLDEKISPPIIVAFLVLFAVLIYYAAELFALSLLFVLIQIALVSAFKKFKKEDLALKKTFKVFLPFIALHWIGLPFAIGVLIGVFVLIAIFVLNLLLVKEITGSIFYSIAIVFASLILFYLILLITLISLIAVMGQEAYWAMLGAEHVDVPLTVVE